MCGVFGFVGLEQDVPGSVGRALKSLEYRGYDSWGMVWNDGVELRTVKQVGKVPSRFTFDAVSRIAVGHTRWATHGGVTEANAHPHLDPTGRVAIVHNGIIENARELRSLLPQPSRFVSQTDSEVVAHLLAAEVLHGRSIVEGLCRVFPLLEGQNAIVAIDQQTESIAAAMNVSPLVVGLGPEGSFIASDPFALANRATQMIVAPRDAVVEIAAQRIRAFAFDGSEIPLPDSHPVPDVTADEIGSFSTFMEKEMSEQPDVLRWQAMDADAVLPLAEMSARAKSVIFTGCGSAFYACRLGASWLGRIAERPALAVQASEIADYSAFLGPHALVIAVTQSGETADVLAAMEFAERAGSDVAAVTNVELSSAARLAQVVVPLGAGRERSVLATKSMTAMMGRLLSLASLIESSEGDISSLATAANSIANLQQDEGFEHFLQSTASIIGTQEHTYVIGRGDGVSVAQEAALKIKEASYIHAEAFAAGELKHGAIALIEPGSPCLLFTTDCSQVRDTATSAQEVRSRGGYTIGVGPGFEGVTELSLELPGSGPELAIVEVYVAQALALELALRRNLDPDYPRNLAKSVTVK